MPGTQNCKFGKLDIHMVTFYALLKITVTTVYAVNYCTITKTRQQNRKYNRNILRSISLTEITWICRKIEFFKYWQTRIKTMKISLRFKSDWPSGNDKHASTDQKKTQLC